MNTTSRSVLLGGVLALVSLASACGSATDVPTAAPDTVAAPSSPPAPVDDTPSDEGEPNREHSGGPEDEPTGDPFEVTLGFGSNADRSFCGATVLTNDADDGSRLAEGVSCFLDRADHGGIAVWDVLVPTVEGDPVLYRYDATDEGVLLVRDTRLDAFGVPEVVAERCADITAGSGFLPTGVDCVPAEHPGFPEAASTEPVPISTIVDAVSYYGACGNETVDVDGIEYFPVPRAQGIALSYRHIVIEPQRLVRVAPPGPGDDIGTFVVFDDGAARFESESGWVIWLTDQPIAYYFEC